VITIATTTIRLPPHDLIGDIDHLVREKILPELPGIVTFKAEYTDKFYLADAMMTGAGKKLLPRWVPGIKADFLGTAKQFVETIRTAKLHIVVARYEGQVWNWPNTELVTRPPRPATPAPAPATPEPVFRVPPFPPSSPASPASPARSVQVIRTVRKRGRSRPHELTTPPRRSQRRRVQR
jgi:hypothetical protein